MITIIGSLNMDLVTYTERMPKIGETVIGREFKQNPGGKGANQASAVAKLGAPVNLLGCVGADEMGRAMLDSLQEAGVDVSGVARQAESATGIAAITVDGDGNNYIVVAPGANGRLSPEHIREARTVIAASEIIVAQLEIPLETVRFSLKLAKELGKITILNPAPAVELTPEILRLIDFIIPNEIEASFLTGIKIIDRESAISAAKALCAMGPRHTLITLGKQGAVFYGPEGVVFRQAFPVNAKDSTAAGDAFVAGFTVAWLEGKGPRQSLDYACAAGALTTTKMGAQTALPTAREVGIFLSNSV